MKQQYYYTAKPVPGGYKGRIYTYDSTGNIQQDYWLSSIIFTRKERAIDDAAAHIEENDLDTKLGEIHLDWIE